MVNKIFRSSQIEYRIFVRNFVSINNETVIQKLFFYFVNPFKSTGKNKIIRFFFSFFNSSLNLTTHIRFEFYKFKNKQNQLNL